MFKNSKLAAIYVIKEDLINNKISIIDCLTQESENFLNKFVAIKKAQ